MFYQFQHSDISEYTKKEYGRNFSFPMHLHQSFEFITVFEGEMTVTVDNLTYNLTPGKALMIFPNQLHSLSSSDSSHMLCIFSKDLIKTYANKVSELLPLSNLFSPKCYLIDELNDLNESSSLTEKKGVFYSLCSQFDKTANYIQRKTDDKNILYQIFKFVELNYNKECSLYELAAQTGYSYSYLSRYFKKIVGLSFNTYVNQFKISKACYLLDNTDCSILNCSLECGYESLRSFNRNFKEILSITPNEYRKMDIR